MPESSQIYISVSGALGAGFFYTHGIAIPLHSRGFSGVSGAHAMFCIWLPLSFMTSRSFDFSITGRSA